MPQIVDNLADLTAHMDRDDLESALVQTIKDLLSPLSIQICRSVGERDDERWLTCIKQGQNDLVPKTDEGWGDLDDLPKLAAFPLRRQAVDCQRVTRQTGLPSLTVFPLSKNAAFRSVVEITTPSPISDVSVNLLTGVLRLYSNFQNLLDYGERDTLTELLNRKTFDGAFLKATTTQYQALEVIEGDQRGNPGAGNYWLAMIDIDHFKRVNDTYGHLIGDEVLLLLARLMRSCFRMNDQLYRFGGEEFVVLMRCKAETDALQVLERLRARTENYLFPQVGRITVSMGLSEVRTGDTPSGAIERADKALYFAKGNGRNQVRSYAALVTLGALADQAANVGEVELF
jgi:diguanylate cyclase (GGDEF)-like protein